MTFNHSVSPAQPQPTPAASAGVIGPNAVIQLVEAIRAAGMEATLAPVFVAAGQPAWLAAPPDRMTDERPVGTLHRLLRATLPPDQAAFLLDDAGRRTADYLLAHRIPPLAQAFLKHTPSRLAAAVLVRAIRRHAWTFAGSGVFQAQAGQTTVLTLTGNPLCTGEIAPRPVCLWHAAVFRRLFAALVTPAALVAEVHCQAAGGRCCQFTIDLR
ncbi:MAG TPA: bacteriochlorophyll 4-vinyl reductase [Rhodopila sp.]|nr:bacteriochlorophyll 4-vinyl reductase [Rhodopila sp.]